MATRETGGEPAAQDVRNATDRILDRGREEARTILGQQQQRAAEGLTGVADALHAAAGRMEGGEIGFVARYAETAADQVETWARRVQQRDIDDVLSEAENYARRNPEIFVGGAFLAGFLVARVAKASSDRRRVRERGDRQGTDGGGRTPAAPAGPTGGGSAGPRGYGYAGGYPGGIAGDTGPRASTTTAGAKDLAGDAALSAATGPATPARTDGSPGSSGSPGPGGGPSPGSPSATETVGTGSPSAATSARTAAPGPGSQGPGREATPARPNETAGPAGRGDRK